MSDGDPLIPCSYLVMFTSLRMGSRDLQLSLRLR